MKTLLSGGILLGGLLAAGAARADVPPVEAEPCSGKAAGAACTLNGSAGTCTDTTCTKADLAHWDRDASGGPPTIQYACVLCILSGDHADAAVATDAAMSTDGGADAASGTDGPKSSDDSSCSLGSATGTTRVGPWLLAGAFSFLFLLGRRRRRP